MHVCVKSDFILLISYCIIDHFVRYTITKTVPSGFCKVGRELQSPDLLGVVKNVLKLSL